MASEHISSQTVGKFELLWLVVLLLRLIVVRLRQ